MRDLAVGVLNLLGESLLSVASICWGLPCCWLLQFLAVGLADRCLNVRDEALTSLVSLWAALYVGGLDILWEALTLLFLMGGFAVGVLNLLGRLCYRWPQTVGGGHTVGRFNPCYQWHFSGAALTFVALIFGQACTSVASIFRRRPRR